LIGAQLFRSVLSSAELERIALLFGDAGTAGRRLAAPHLVPYGDLVGPAGPIGRTATVLIGRPARLVRAIAFDKSPQTNWRLGWHQDRVIAVRERLETEGFTSWSCKSGQLHVQPPIEIIDRMVTLRVHVDAVDRTNAPLRIVAGSHKLGRLSDAEIADVTNTGDVITCVAQAGDIWAYSTGIVHASAEQKGRGRRRVVQLDYSADALPGGLKWQRLI
jgi:Phytanoyl-CoA dioxygenase (PhyH)